jgi:hypothetical protein
MPKYQITVEIECDSAKDAIVAIGERLEHDEDYGFDYQFTKVSSPVDVVNSDEPTREQGIVAYNTAVEFLGEWNLLLEYVQYLCAYDKALALHLSRFLKDISDEDLDKLREVALKPFYKKNEPKEEQVSL